MNPGTKIQLTTIAGERKWMPEVYAYPGSKAYEKAAEQAIANSLPDSTNLEEGTICIVEKEVKEATQYYARSKSGMVWETVEPFDDVTIEMILEDAKRHNLETRLAIVLKEQPEAENTNTKQIKTMSQTLPSQFQIGDTANLWFYSGGNVKGVEISAVKFYRGKPYYDVKVFVDKDDPSSYTTLEAIDSAFVVKVVE